MFYSYILTEKQLEENSFPKWMISGEEGLVYIPNFKKSEAPMSSSKQQSKQPQQQQYVTSTTGDSSSSILLKNCKRCRSTFTLLQVGNLKRYSSTNSECVYHWGKLRSIRFDRTLEQRYSCCSADVGSDGCEVGKHVYDGDYDGQGTGNKKTYLLPGRNQNSLWFEFLFYF